ncbi:MAG: UbiA family prenyltransferase, partial [Bacillota bacterium]|nr:UbiA family prenyltransferase [Bacillota bacterium]
MIKRFFDLVELRTKITSVFAFGLALAYLFLNQVAIHWDRTAIFFVSMLAIDMMATALNNVKGARSEKETLPVSKRNAWIIIALLAWIGVGLGLYLSRIAGMVVLATGALCFFFGVLYSYGPVPISYTPLGEVTSGIFYGLVIPFLTLQINYPTGTLLEIRYLGMSVSANFQVMPILKLLILSAIPVLLTANIMLANNLCDLEKDRAIGRHTLPS